MKLLYFDCFNGASGDMVLGALLDAGLPLEELRGALGSLALDGADVSATRVLRAGVSATNFTVTEHGAPAHSQGGPNHTHEHAHEHDHSQGHSHPHQAGDAHSHAPSGAARPSAAHHHP